MPLCQGRRCRVRASRTRGWSSLASARFRQRRISLRLLPIAVRLAAEARLRGSCMRPTRFAHPRRWGQLPTAGRTSARWPADQIESSRRSSRRPRYRAAGGNRGYRVGWRSNGHVRNPPPGNASDETTPSLDGDGPRLPGIQADGSVSQAARDSSSRSSLVSESARHQWARM
jgi:hypothetical protein